jgi:putative ABC transport system permease protein
MSVFTLLRLAFRVILRNKTRALLTVLGIVIGVAAVIAMVALGTGAQENISRQISSLGANLIILIPGTTNVAGVRGGGGSSTTVDVDDIDALRREVKSISNLAPTNRQQVQIVAGDSNWGTNIVGTTPAYYVVRDWRAEIGTEHSELDEASQNKVCVIGKTVAMQLFGTDDPIDKWVRIKKVPFRIIGVLSSKGQSPMGSDQDDTVIIPFSVFRQRMAGTQRDQIQAAYAAALDANSAQAAVDEMTAVLRQRHHLRDNAEDDFSIRNLADIAAASQEVSNSMTLLLGSIAGVSLLVGGIGIMNTMLVSVTERTREIGIRMAVGAKASDILVQFLVEAVVLSAIGGAIGVLVGWWAAKLLSDTTGWVTVFDPAVAALAFGVSAAVGVFFGFWPARRAAKLDPIDALRYE